MAKQDQFGRYFVGVKLAEERLHDLLGRRVRDMDRIIGAVAVIRAGTEEKHLDAGLSGGLMQTDDVRLCERARIHAVVGLYAGHRADAVA